jgi:hypothetical protein
MESENSIVRPTVSKWAIIKRKIKNIFYMILFILIITLGILIFWKYFYTYSDGSRTGLLQKFSRKGFIFKTYEGEMILSSVASSNNVVLASEKFFFSVSDKKLAHQLDSLQGGTVTVYYKQKNAPLFWKGDTPYYVDSVRLR